MSLEGRGLAIGYGAFRVGEELDVAVEHGELVMLLGPNGCGKSTLFRTLLGLIPALAGEVRVAYVPQSTLGYFPFTVLDTVLMGRAAHHGPFSAPGRGDREAAAAALGRLGLDELSERAFTRLSGGQRQLVLIARALAQRSGYVVMDEPTASLDFGNQVRVLGTVRDVADAGAGVLVASHDPDQALRVADRVVVMAAGRIVAQGAPREILTDALLEATYGVPVRVADVTAGDRVLGRTCYPAAGP